MQRVELSFPGGTDVAAHYKGHTILTAQLTRPGEPAKAPSPFDLFLASIATCAGYYAVAFCRARDLPTEELRVFLEPVKNPETKRVETIKVRVGLPAVFPEKYEKSILRAIDQCTVKKHILDPPEFDIATFRSD